MIRRMVAGLLVVALGTACADRPAVSLAENLVRAQIDDGRSTRVNIVSIQKTNGQDGNVFGVPVYTLAFAGDAAFTEDAYYSLTNDFMVGTPRITTTSATQIPGTCLTNVYYCVNPAPAKARKGDRIHFTGSVTFSKSERGWGKEAFELAVTRLAR